MDISRGQTQNPDCQFLLGVRAPKPIVALAVGSAQATALWRNHSGGSVGPRLRSSDTCLSTLRMRVAGAPGGRVWFGGRQSLKERPASAADSGVAFGKLLNL